MIPFQVAGGTGKNKSVQFSSEITRGMYLVRSETNNRISCNSFPGLKLVSRGTGKDRGHTEMLGVRYVVNATTLYRELSSGVREEIGTIPGSDRCIFANDGTSLFVVANGNLYKATGNAVEKVDVSIISGLESVCFINQQIIITSKRLFAVSNVGDGTTYNALNYSAEESAPDDLVRAYPFNQMVYMLGAETVVPWYNSGVGNPPLDRQETSLINIGVAGKHAVTNSNQFMYWLGNDRKIYQCVGSSAQPVNTSGISHILESLDYVSNCIASHFVIDGQDFILFKFTSDGEALVYSEQNQYWFSLNSGTSLSGGNWLGNAVHRVYEKNLVTDLQTGNTYELDPDTYTDNGQTRLLVRNLPTFTGKDIGLTGRRIMAKQMRINMQVGVGLVTGQGQDPVIMCQFSGDGGHIWGPVQHIRIGRMGEYAIPVDFWDFVTGYQIKARIMCSDPVYLAMFDGEIDLEDAGF